MPLTGACALTDNPAGELLLCRTTPNPLSHTGQGCCGFLGSLHKTAHHAYETDTPKERANVDVKQDKMKWEEAEKIRISRNPQV